MGKRIYRCREKEIDRSIALKSDIFSYHLSHLKNDERFVASNTGQFTPKDKFGSSHYGYSVLPPVHDKKWVGQTAAAYLLHAPSIWSRGDTETDDLILVFLISRFIQAHRHE